jgi:hypothetical protein
MTLQIALMRHRCEHMGVLDRVIKLLSIKMVICNPLLKSTYNILD